MRRLIIAALAALILLCVPLSTPQSRGFLSIHSAPFVINMLRVGAPAAASPQAEAPPVQAPASERGAAPSAQESVSLEHGKPIERELSGAQSHSYKITTISGQYLHVLVVQRGIDVAVALFAPDGKKIIEADSDHTLEGSETVSVIAEAAGVYLIEMRSPEKTAGAGRYEIKVEELRAATAEDKYRVSGESVFREAERLKDGTLEDKRKSIEKYNESLELYRRATDRKGEAAALNDIGAVYSSIGEPRKALEKFNEALPISRAGGYRRGEAFALTSVGEVYGSLGENQKALEKSNEALPIWRAVGDRIGEAITLNNIGAVYSSMGEPQKALEKYNEARTIRRAIGDRRGEAVALINIGAVYEDLGETQKALEGYNKALPSLRAVGDRSLEAIVLNNIGVIYNAVGETQKALEKYNEALPIFRAVGKRSGEAALLNNIGRLYAKLGEPQKALEKHNEALPIRQAMGDRRGEATIFNYIGLIYLSLGETQKALEKHNEALLISRAMSDRMGEAYALTNIGGVYWSLGENQKALEKYNEALLIFKAVGGRRGEAMLLSNIGRAYADLGETQKALEKFNEALPISRAVGDRSGEATIFNNIGRVYADLGETQKALEGYNKALPSLRAAGNRRVEANTLNNIGEAYLSLGETQKALEKYNEALSLRRYIGDRNGEADALLGIARVEQKRGNLNQARQTVEQAVGLIESLRTNISGQELRSSFFHKRHEFFESYIDVLMQMHKQDPAAALDALALAISERARARSLLELLNEARADIRQGVDASLLERERSLRQRLNASAAEQVSLLNRKHTSEQAGAVAKEIAAITAEHDEIQAQIRARSPQYAALTQPQPLSLAEIQQQVLDPETLLLEYSLGNNASYLFVVSPTSITSHRLPKRAEIEAATRRMRELLTAPQPQLGDTEAKYQVRIKEARESYWPQAAELSRMLLGPAASQFGRKRLVIVADGALQYFPFAALPVPSPGNDERRNSGAEPQPLFVKHEIVSLPSASTLATLRRETAGRKPSPKSLAVLADPVFTDDDTRVRRNLGKAPTKEKTRSADSDDTDIVSLRMSRSGRETGVIGAEAGFGRLLSTRREAAAIFALVPEQERLQALDFEASRTTALRPELGEYRIVHFATHGLLNTIHPELSGIVLSLVDKEGKPQDGFLRLQDIYNLKLPAELVVLSACQTGLGKEIKGEGLIGLTRGFMYAGAPRVVASLWKVDDRATSELMKRFYQGLLGPAALRPAASLRQAQLSIWKEKQWREPYYWAAFVLQGEWK
jgi:CHAT domain-containing protein/predicted negative regulator of RcsB-dependent stress response